MELKCKINIAFQAKFVLNNGAHVYKDGPGLLWKVNLIPNPRGLSPNKRGMDLD